MPKCGAIPGVTSIRGLGEFHPLLGKAEPDKSVSLGQCNTCKLATALCLHAQVIALWGPLVHRRIENASRHAGKLHPLSPRVVTRMPHSPATGQRAQQPINETRGARACTDGRVVPVGRSDRARLKANGTHWQRTTTSNGRPLAVAGVRVRSRRRHTRMFTPIPTGGWTSTTRLPIKKSRP
jgi:hypothetical protein